MGVGLGQRSKGCCNMLWLGLIPLSLGDTSALSSWWEILVGSALKYLFRPPPPPSLLPEVASSEPSPCPASLVLTRANFPRRPPSPLTSPLPCKVSHSQALGIIHVISPFAAKSLMRVE